MTKYSWVITQQIRTLWCLWDGSYHITSLLVAIILLWHTIICQDLSFVSNSLHPQTSSPYYSWHCKHLKIFCFRKCSKKTLKICVVMSEFFEPRNEGKIWDLFKKFQFKKISRKAQVSLAFFDVVNCNNECKPVKPQLSKNHEKTCTFLKIFWREKS